MEFYGLLGEKLSHSLSPKIHNKLYSELNIEGAYKLLEVERSELYKLPDALKILKIKGINVTIPYKEDIMQYLDEISKEALEIGAVNTVLIKDGKLHGYNTDYYGFGAMLEENNIDVANKEVVVLGSGGASKAVISYLINNNALSIKIVTRKIGDNVKSFSPKIKFLTYEDWDEMYGQVLINTTPVGMYPKVDECPLEAKEIGNFEDIVDLIYNPKETKLMKIGKDLGKNVCGGLGMLVNQAIKAEEIWLDTIISKEISNNIYSEINKEFQ